MIVQVDKFIRDVRVSLDENQKERGFLLAHDKDTLELDEIIEDSLSKAVELIEMACPLEYLDEGYQLPTDEFFLESNLSGWVILPDNFMRLQYFKMHSWLRGVTESITPEDPKYLRQHSKFKGLRGSYERPVVAIVNKAEGKCLEFFSSKDDQDYIEHGLYRPIPYIDDNGGIQVSSHCYDASVKMAAGIVLSILGNEHAQDLMTLANALIRNLGKTNQQQQQS